jgi:alkylation response protein AidB-like acyl-CoA dehydrogenase
LSDAEPHAIASSVTRADPPANLSALVAQLQATAPGLDQAGAVPTHEVRLLAEAGLLAAPVQRHLGGLGLGTEAGGTASLLGLLAEIGRGNLSLGRIYEGHVNALHLIATYGTHSQVVDAARDARDGRLLFGIWNTEGSDGVTIEPVGGGSTGCTEARRSGPGRASWRAPSCRGGCRTAAGRCAWSRWTESAPGPTHRGGGQWG